MTLTLKRDRLSELLGGAKDVRVVVVGDAMLDVYLSGDVDRISPEAPVPVVRVRERRYALGGACNVAQNVVAMGARCDLVAAVGSDTAGRALRSMLAEIGAHDSALVEVGRPTTQKTRVVARSQQLLRIDEESDADLDEDDVDRLLTTFTGIIAEADALVLEDYNKGVLVPKVIASCVADARKRNIPIIVDPKFRNFFCYGGATVFKPNRRELEAALGATLDLTNDSNLPGALKQLGVENLLLTLGEHGMVLISSAGEVGRVPTVAREVYDVVGAGDTVTAYLAAVMAAGGAAAEAAVVANIAAGIEVGKLGAATVSASEVLAYADEHHLLQ